MKDALVVFVTSSDRPEADRLAQTLVGENVAACVNILSGVHSVYRWEGKVTSSEECLLMIKTTTERFADLEKRIRQLHSYQVPEIIGVPIAQGSEPYLNWLEESVRR